MKIVTFNVGGCVDAYPSLGQLWDRQSPDVLAVTETWLSEARSFECSAQAFYAHGFRGASAKSHSGGVCLFVKKSLRARLLFVVRNVDCQAVVTLVEGVVIAACYAASRATTTNMQELLDVLRECRRGKCFFVGDFNARHVGWRARTDAAGKSLAGWCADRRMTVLAPVRPTCYPASGGSSTIDLGLMSHHFRCVPKVSVVTSLLLKLASDLGSCPSEVLIGRPAIGGPTPENTCFTVFQIRCES